MLLELLKHHEGLFMAAIGPLIAARKCRDLTALASTCKILHEFIFSNIDVMTFHLKYINVLRNLSGIRTTYQIIKKPKQTSILHSINICNKKFIIYSLTIFNKRNIHPLFASNIIKSNGYTERVIIDDGGYRIGERFILTKNISLHVRDYFNSLGYKCQI